MKFNPNMSVKPGKSGSVDWIVYATAMGDLSVTIYYTDVAGEEMESHPLHPHFASVDDAHRWVRESYIPRMEKP